MLFFAAVCAAGVIASILCSVIWFGKKNVIESAVMGIFLWLSSHIFASMGLFVIDRYAVFRTAAAAMILDIILLAVVIFVRRSKPFSVKELFRCEFSVKEMLIPIVVCVIALPFTAVNNEFFGMGQDEGVYQTQAISFIYGNTKRQKDFEEYHALDTDEERDAFEYSVRNHLRGWDIGSNNYPETVYDRNVSRVSGIYHGIPTYAALLAMWGTMFGIEDMADIQMIFYVCAIFIVYFVSRNLKLKKLSSLCACAAAAAAPVVIWVAKSSLTEIFLTLLPLTFLYFMTDDSEQGHKWLSALPIAVFACYHVSVFTMIPMFFIIYAAMYLFTREKQYAVLMPLILAGYIASYFAMRHIQPFYTMNNYRDIFVGGIGVENISIVISAVSVLGIIAAGVYIYIIRRNTPKDFNAAEMVGKASSSRGFDILLKFMIAFPIIFIAAKGIAKYDTWEEMSLVSLMGFVANGGVLLIPLGIIAGFIFSKSFSQNVSRLVLMVMFFYCVLLYSAFMRYEVQYYYYYSRYLAPFIPIAVLFSVTALDRFGGKLLCPVTAAGLLYLAPFDGYLMLHKDDTRMEWSVLDDMTDYIEGSDCVVISPKYMDTTWLPLKNMTGASFFPENSDDAEQFYKFSVKYGRVLFITSQEQDEDSFSLIYTNKIKNSEDDLNYTGEFVPMSERFRETQDIIYVYCFDKYQFLYTASADYGKFDGVSALESTFCWTDEENTELLCGLYPHDYELTVTLGCGIPLDEISSGSVDVNVFLNGEKIGTETISAENNGQPLSFDVPEELVKDGKNTLEIHSQLWEASLVNPADDRNLGIPIESLCFKLV